MAGTQWTLTTSVGFRKGGDEGEGQSTCILARPSAVCQGLWLCVDWGHCAPCPAMYDLAYAQMPWPLSRVRTHENSWTRPPAGVGDILPGLQCHK